MHRSTTSHMCVTRPSHGNAAAIVDPSARRTVHSVVDALRKGGERTPNHRVKRVGFPAVDFAHGRPRVHVVVLVILVVLADDTTVCVPPPRIFCLEFFSGGGGGALSPLHTIFLGRRTDAPHYGPCSWKT